jgi:hypothetical protein
VEELEDDWDGGALAANGGNSGGVKVTAYRICSGLWRLSESSGGSMPGPGRLSLLRSGSHHLVSSW